MLTVCFLRAYFKSIFWALRDSKRFFCEERNLLKPYPKNFLFQAIFYKTFRLRHLKKPQIDIYLAEKPMPSESLCHRKNRCQAQVA